MKGKYNACRFVHLARGLQCMVHGDDFVTAGDRKEARWFKGELEKRSELKTKVVGGAQGESREKAVLDCIMRKPREGWECEADKRHAELFIRAMTMEDGKAVATAVLRLLLSLFCHFCLKVKKLLLDKVLESSR